jgi:hypothetical protein
MKNLFQSTDNKGFQTLPVRKPSNRKEFDMPEPKEHSINKGLEHYKGVSKEVEAIAVKEGLARLELVRRQAVLIRQLADSLLVEFKKAQDCGMIDLEPPEPVIEALIDCYWRSHVLEIGNMSAIRHIEALKRSDNKGL